MGAMGIRYPKKVGGSGGNTTLYCIVMEELARGLMSLGATVAMQGLMATNGLYLYGNEKMHDEFLRPALRGEKIGAFQLTEPEAGSDLGAVKTSAVKTSDGWVINGMKTWSTNGPYADFHTVLCQTNPKKGLRGLMFFLVPKTTPGFSTSERFKTLGTRTSALSEIYFNNCHIPDEYQLGQEFFRWEFATAVASVDEVTRTVEAGIDARAAAGQRIQARETLSRHVRTQPHRRQPPQQP